MRSFHDTFDTPFGPFSIALDEQGSVLATAFGDAARLCSRFTPGQHLHDPSRVAESRREVEEYFAGKRKTFTVPLAPRGTPFQNRVWSALRRIPYGQTVSYGAVAALIGTPRASRAVGRANALNPICLLTPCHRVIGADGSLTGFAFGEAIKRGLLDFEREQTLCFEGLAPRPYAAAAA